MNKTKFPGKKTILTFILTILISDFFYGQTGKPVVYNIRARAVSSNRIEITWSVPNDTDFSTIKHILLYRNTKPITSAEGLEPIASIKISQTSYRDTLQDFRDYYYAAVCVTTENYSQMKNSDGDRDLYFDEETDFHEKKETVATEIYSMILPGINSTISGTKINGKVKTSSDIKAAQEKINREKQQKDYTNRLRDQPLPYIDVLGDTKFEHKKKISDENKETVLELLRYKSSESSSEIRERYIFEEDAMYPKEENRIRLFEILSTTFMKMNYREASAKLYEYINSEEDTIIRNRAIFYLAESFYFQSDYPNAVKNFLRVEEAYPKLSRKWIQSSLNLFEIPQE